MSANPAFMKSFAAVSDAELARAREDPLFRQKLLTHNLEVLLASLQRYRSLATSNRGTAKQLREGVELAVRLAELIQSSNAPKTRR
jgi:hypothetical protein